MWRLDDVLDGLTPDESWIPTLSQIREQLSQTAYQDIANMSHEMYPPTLRLGLIAALSALLAEHSTCKATLAADDVVHNWDYPTNNRIPFSVRLAVYQIVEDYLKTWESEGFVSQTLLTLSALGNTLWLKVKVQEPPPRLAPFPHKQAEQQIKLLSGELFWAEDGHCMAIGVAIFSPSINRSRYVK
jgi:signal transduction histidine kinase